MLPISELVINAKVFYLELCNCDLVLFNHLNLYYISFRIILSSNIEVYINASNLFNLKQNPDFQIKNQTIKENKTKIML